VAAIRTLTSPPPVSGHLHVIKWLHESGYRWDYRAFGLASIAALDTSMTPAHNPITQYLVDNKCPGWEDMRVKWAKIPDLRRILV
jgi:hypothetical protein